MPLTSNDSALIRNLSIKTLFVDERDILWIGTKERGLYLLDGPWSHDRRIKFIPLVTQFFQAPGFRWEINALHESPYLPNQVWIGTNNGLFLLNRETGLARHTFHSQCSDSLGGNCVLSMMEDKGGMLWIGISSGKFDRVDLRSQYFITHKAGTSTDSLSQNHGTAICRLSHDPSRLLMGSEDGTLTLVDIPTSRQVGFTALDSALPSAIDQFARLNGTDTDTVILTREHGLWLYSSPAKRITPLKPGALQSRPNCILTSMSTGAVFIGNAEGLHLYHPDRTAPADLESFPACRNLDITLLQNDNQGGLYLVSRQGLFHLSHPDPNGKPEPIALGKLNAAPDIRSILCRYNGHVLLGSDPDGLLRISDGKIEPIRIPLPNLGPSTGIKAIFEDDLLQVWVCAQEGLYLLSSSAKAYDEWTFFAEADRIPLPLSGGGLLDSPTGQFFLTSAQGLLQINLNGLILPTPSDISLISIQAVEPDSRERMPLNNSDDSTIRIPSQFSTLELNFAVLDYFAPEKNRISYRLFGLDSDWRLAGEGERRIRYRDLKPGAYTLYVNGLNAHRQSGSSGLILYFDLHVPLLRRPLFWLSLLGIVLLITGGAFWLIVKYRSRPELGTAEFHPVSATNMNQWASRHNMSEREIEIINLILAGKSNKEIEEALFISIKTVKSHIYNIYKKANVKSRFELITLFTHNDNGRIAPPADSDQDD